MPQTTRIPTNAVLRHTSLTLLTILLASGHVAAAPNDAPTPMARPAVASENPLRSADEATQKQAHEEAWSTFQRSCRPCHGSLGAGDGPYAQTFAMRGADLRRASRTVAVDSVRFTRIRDGAASLPERSWESSMPAFGGELDDRQIWGLVALLADLAKEGTGLSPDATGADIYAARCAVCHGAGGAGDGPLASELQPAPRNFVRGAYRLRATAQDAAPLDTDVMGTIAHGLGDTAMGNFLSMGSQRIEDIGAHLRSFNPGLFATQPPAFTPDPVPDGSLMELANRGRAVYEQAKCAECHGVGGRGDGPGATALKDDTGRRSIPTDLTKRWHMKYSNGAPAIYRTLSTGMNGTPMTSFVSALSSDDRWTLAHYLERLARTRSRFTPTIQAGVLHDPIALDLKAEVWNAIPTAGVFLGPQVEVPPYWTQPAIDSIDVKVAVNDQQIGILMVWDDRSRDVHNDDTPAATPAAAFARYGSWRLADRIALQFAEKTDPKGTLPPLYLGSAQRPVVRWMWSADRVDGTDHNASIERVAGPDQAPTAVTDAPVVQTTAAFADGQWRVLMLAKRPPKSQPSIAIAFQAWDGASGETGRWQSLSSWMNVNLR